MKSRASKLIGIFVVVVIAIVLVRLLNNADGEVVSLGKPCTTAGEIIEVQELAFECQEIESVLIWQEYSEINEEVAAPSFSTDPSITSVSMLASVDECRISNSTKQLNNPGEASNGSGFPRSPDLPPSTRDLQVLVVPVSFTGFEFDESTYNSVKDAYVKVAELFSSVSYGRATVQATFSTEEDWIYLEGSLSDFGLGNRDNSDVFVRKILNLFLETHSADGYDVIEFITKNDSPMYNLQINTALNAGNSRYGTQLPISAVLNAGIVGRYRIHAHELGHAWLGFDDLYDTGTSEKYLGGWDLMDGAGGISELSSWLRWLPGWIEDTQVRCIAEPGETRHFVSPLNFSSSQPKMVVVKLSEVSALVVELRVPTKFDFNKESVVVYVVDTRYLSGNGPIRLRGVLEAEGESLSTDGLVISLEKFDPAGALLSMVNSN